MLKERNIPYNKYFLIPFLGWVIIGGLLQMIFTQEQLFAAINTHFNDPLNFILYYTTWMGTGQVITLCLLLLMFLKPFRNLWYFAAASVCNLIPFFTQQWLKSYFDCPRPLYYFHEARWIHILPDWPVLMHRSFPSGHSEGAFCFFCFLSLLLPEKYYKVGAVLFVLALAVCYSRLYLAAHFFEDVYAGSIMGAVMSMLLFAVMKKYKSRLMWPKNKQALTGNA